MSGEAKQRPASQDHGHSNQESQRIPLKAGPMRITCILVQPRQLCLGLVTLPACIYTHTAGRQNSYAYNGHTDRSMK